jgi:hypothetical protein
MEFKKKRIKSAAEETKRQKNLLIIGICIYTAIFIISMARDFGRHPHELAGALVN